eukprot:9781593-Prorocentrum_lima.AAC.1
MLLSPDPMWTKIHSKNCLRCDKLPFDAPSVFPILQFTQGSPSFYDDNGNPKVLARNKYGK